MKSGVPGDASLLQPRPRPCPRASELCSASAMLQGQGKLSRGCWCVRGFSGFLEMRDWDLLVHRLPWGVMHVEFIRRAVNCTDACKPVSQMLLSGQQQAQLPGAGGPALSAAGSSPEHELKQPECHRRMRSHCQDTAGILVHPSGPSRAVVPRLGAVPPGHHAGQSQPSAVTRRFVPSVTPLWPPGSAGLSGRAAGDFP